MSVPDDEHDARLRRLRLQLLSLDTFLRDATAADLDRPSATGGWSARQQLAHLARYHQVFLEQMQKALHDLRPTVPRYRAEEDPDFSGWVDLPTAEILRRLYVLREEVIEFFEDLKPKDWSRVAVHSVYGEMDLATWLEFFLVHEGHHLYLLFQRSRGGTGAS